MLKATFALLWAIQGDSFGDFRKLWGYGYRSYQCTVVLIAHKAKFKLPATFGSSFHDSLFTLS